MKTIPLATLIAQATPGKLNPNKVRDGFDLRDANNKSVTGWGAVVQTQHNAALLAHAWNMLPELVKVLETITSQRHTHDGRAGSDTCARCGKDLRDTVHFRVGDSAEKDLEEFRTLLQRANNVPVEDEG